MPAIAGLLSVPANASIQHDANGFLITGSNSSVLISETDGSILTVKGAGGGVIATGGEQGLWSLTASTDGGITASGTLNAADFSSGTSANSFQWSQPSSDTLALSYDNAQASVRVTVSSHSDGIDLSASVTPKGNVTVLGINLPGRLRFDPANLKRFIAPSHSSDSVGMAYNPAFFQAQPSDRPASWGEVIKGPGAYVSLYGADCGYAPETAVPISFTPAATDWLGPDLVAKWSGAQAVVSRPPAPNQADLVLVTSSNGAFFSGSQLGGGTGSGLLLRIGGPVNTVVPGSAPIGAGLVELSKEVVIAAIEHLVQSSTNGRTKVALLAMERGPAIGYNWPSAVTVQDWLDRLKSSSILNAWGIEIDELTNVSAINAATAGTDYLAILNPYGELAPASASPDGLAAMAGDIGSYVRAGGNWFEVGGHAFYQALQPLDYYNIDLMYPPAFADFLHLETNSGEATVFGVQPVQTNPLNAWSTDPSGLFVPGRLAWGGDGNALGGAYCERGFATYVPAGATWQSPLVRLCIGHSAADALQSYCQANELKRTLADKWSGAPEKLAKFKQSVLINYLASETSGVCATLTGNLSKLPSPSLVHFAQYLWKGFDKAYPDHLDPATLAPNAQFGTPGEFQAFLATANGLGLLTMPYTNPTFWGVDPIGPTAGAHWPDGLVRLPDGSLSWESYFGNGGFTACPWQADVKAANLATVNQFTGQLANSYTTDMLFEDQIGARTWQYDLNPASPTPYAYMAGNTARAAEDSLHLPVSTENGYDRLANFESQFCGLVWGLVPTSGAPSWRRFLTDRYLASTMQIFPLAQYLAHDKLMMNYNDLNAPVANDETVAWTLGLGYAMTYRLEAADLDRDATRQWLLWIDRLQKSVCSLYVGEPVQSFTHQWGGNVLAPAHGIIDARNPVAADNGVIAATYGPVNVIANLGPQPLSTGSYTLGAYGFVASAPGLLAAKIVPPGASNPVSYLAQQSGTGGALDFWVYSTGNQNATLLLPPGLNGSAMVKMDGGSPTQTLVENNTVSVSLTSGSSSSSPALWHGTVVPPFSFSTVSGSAITITGYSGPGGTVTLPDTLAGLPVTAIAPHAFSGRADITSLTIPGTISSIGDYAFYQCSGLTQLTFNAGVASIGTAAFQECTSLTAVSIPDSVSHLGNFAFYGCAGLGKVAIGSGVSSIGDGAFQACSSFTSVTLPKTVTSIGIWAFSFCPNLRSVYFLGDSPGADSSTFANDPVAVLYYMPGTSGWTSPWNGRQPLCWQIGTRDRRMQAGQFGFTITGPEDAVIVVEACSDLAHPAWESVSTNTLVSGTSGFLDTQASNYRSRFYRFRAP